MDSKAQACRKSEKEIERLVAFLGSGLDEVVSDAALQLGRAGDERALPYLVRELEYMASSSSTCRRIGREVAAAIAVIGNVEAVEPLACALEAVTRAAHLVENEWIYEPFRIAATAALGDFGSTHVRTTLVRRLVDVSGNVRCAAAKALAKLGENEWLGVVKGLNVYEDCLRLAEPSDECAIMALEETVESSYGDLALAASRALALIGNDRGADKLRLALDDAKWCARFTFYGKIVGGGSDGSVYDQSGSIDGVSRRRMAIDALCELTTGLPRLMLKVRRLLAQRTKNTGA